MRLEAAFDNAAGAEREPAATGDAPKSPPAAGGPAAVNELYVPPPLDAPPLLGDGTVAPCSWRCTATAAAYPHSRGSGYTRQSTAPT